MIKPQYVKISDTWDYETLSDWYQASIDETRLPVWTDEQMTALTEYFCLYHKEQIKETIVDRAEWQEDFPKAYISLKGKASQKAIYDWFKENAQSIYGKDLKFTYAHARELCGDFYVISKMFYGSKIFCD